MSKELLDEVAERMYESAPHKKYTWPKALDAASKGDVEFIEAVEIVRDAAKAALECVVEWLVSRQQQEKTADVLEFHMPLPPEIDCRTNYMVGAYHVHKNIANKLKEQADES